MKTENETKKITKATFKSFVKKNRASLLVKVGREYDGMVDGCVAVEGGFKAAVDELSADEVNPHTLGLKGVWMVGGGRDYFESYSVNGVSGIRCSNCCGNFIVAVQS